MGGQVAQIIERETGQKVSADTKLESLDLDSLEFLELIMEIQRETGIEIPDAKIAELVTVGDLVNAISG